MKRHLIFVVCSIVAGYSSGIQANLLTNPGFESGLTGWQSTGNADIRHGDPLPHEGQNYVFGRSTPLFSVWQDIDLLGAGLLSSEIDSGAYNVEFGGWQSGWNRQRDSGQISVLLFDSTMSGIGSTSLSSFFSNHTWVEQSGTTPLLAGTRFIRYEFVGTRVSGSNNDGYLDAAYLDVSHSATTVPVPEPGPLALLGLGLAGIGVSRTVIRAAPVR